MIVRRKGVKERKRGEEEREEVCRKEGMKENKYLRE